MNFFGFQITRPASHAPCTTQQAPPATRSLTAEDLALLAGSDSSEAAGPVLTNAYQQVVWVYRAVNVLAEQIANIPFLFSRGERGRENLITTGPLHDFYNRPHPYINRFQYWELRVIWLMLRGESFRIPIYGDAAGSSPLPSDGRGIKGEGSPFRTPPSALPTGAKGSAFSILPSSFSSAGSTLPAPRSTLKRVLILDPAHFQHIVQDHQLLGWRYTGFGPNTPLESQVFLPEEVWHEKLPNPFDFWRGMPPLFTAGLAARTDFAAAAFMNGLMENNADAGVIVHTDQQLAEEQRVQLMAALKNRKHRSGIADRPLLLWGGAQVTRPQLSSAELQFLENRKFSRGEICAAFGVPEEIVTTTDNAKYDVMSGSRLNFIENRVAPLCARLEAEEQVAVKSLDPSATGWFDVDSLPIMQEARRTRLASAKTAFEMGVPFNEVNRVLDLGFKPLPWGDTGHLATNLRDIGEDSSANPI
jgi:HK97 family phage portal protein